MLGLAAYAAFAATLALLGDDASRAPAMVQPAPVGGVAPRAPAAEAAPDPAAAAPAAASPAEVERTTGAAAAAPAARPAQRAAADGVRAVKPKRAPTESLTERDRRALDALIEQTDRDAR